jgi:hypothetical protein
VKTGDALSSGILAVLGDGCSCRCSRRGGGAACLLGEIEIGCCWPHDCCVVLYSGVWLSQCVGDRQVKASTPAVGISSKEKEVEEDGGS